jgi:two-component system, NarL family, invasion response regulator UvrY
MYSVLIADDHAMIRAGLRDWLQREPSISRFAESATSAETLQQLRQATWNLLVAALDEPEEQAGHAQLTEREFQILCRLAEGRSVSQIGAQIPSAKTASAYRARVLAKMQMTTHSDPTSYALRTGLTLA